jgi:hypothetical protein
MTTITLAPLRRFAFIALAVGLPTAVASAADRTWIGAGLKGRGGDGTTFNSPANWSPSAVPGSLDRAIFGVVGGEISFPAGLVINDRLLVSGEGLILLFDLGGGLYRLNSADSSGGLRSFLMATEPSHAASLVLSDGLMTSKHAALATVAGSSADLLVESSGAFHATSGLVVGEGGQGVIDSFGELLTGNVLLGQEPGSGGTLRLEGMSALLLAFGELTSGAGAAELSLTDGALAAVVGDLALGQTPSSTTQATVSGLGSALLVEGDIILGGGLGGVGDLGGLGSFGVESDALVRGADLHVGPSFSLDVKGGRLDANSLSAVAAPIAVGEGSLVIGAPDASVASGFFAGLNEGSASVALADGATLVAPFISLGSAPGGTTQVTVEGSGSLLSSSDILELGWPVVEGGPSGGPSGGGIWLNIRDGGAGEASSVVIRQGATLGVDSGSFEAGSLFMPDDYGVIRGRFTPSATDPFLRLLDGAFLGGALAIEQSSPEISPALGTILPAIESPVIGGRLAAVLAQPLPGLKYYKALPYGAPPSNASGGQPADAVAFEVSKLEVAVGLVTVLPIELPGTPNAIVAGFFDGDGFPDVFVTIPGVNGEPGLGALLINTGGLAGDDDEAGAPPSFVLAETIAVGGDPSGLATADMNLDGRPDFIVSNADDGTIQIIYNTAGGLLGGFLDQGPVIPVGGRPRRVMAADLNNKGLPDLVWTDDQAGQVFTALATGIGSFGAATALSSGSQPSSVCPLDLDNDKDLDLAVVNTGAAFGPGGGSTIGIHLNLASEGGEGFAPVALYSVGDGVTGIAEGDLDGDGIVDLVTADAAAGTISILIGLGDSSFRPAVSVAAGGQPLAIAAGDIDNDAGKDVDIALIVEDEFGQPSLTIFRNDSASGQLVLTILENAESIFGLPQAMTSVDADQDGPADLLLVGSGPNKESGVVTVVQSVPVICPADFTGDGVVDGADLGVLLADYGFNPDSPADLNKDGFVNEIDLLLLLKGIGSCTLDD